MSPSNEPTQGWHGSGGMIITISKGCPSKAVLMFRRPPLPTICMASLGAICALASILDHTHTGIQRFHINIKRTPHHSPEQPRLCRSPLAALATEAELRSCTLQFALRRGLQLTGGRCAQPAASGPFVSPPTWGPTTQPVLATRSYSAEW